MLKKNAIIKNCLKYSDAVKNQNFKETLPAMLKTLDFIKECVSINMRKKMIWIGITKDLICDTYNSKGFDGLKLLLGKDENDEFKVTKSTKVLNKLFSFMKNLNK